MYLPIIYPKMYYVKKRVIEYKCNKATPIRTHVECAHPKLIVTKKLQFTKKVVEIGHNF